MRVFLDACIDPRVVSLIDPLDKVRTAFDEGWHRLADQLLIERIQDRFDVFVTADKGFEYQHNLRKLRFGLVIVSVRKNKVEFYARVEEQLREAIRQVQPGTVAHVEERHSAHT